MVKSLKLPQGDIFLNLVETKFPAIDLDLSGVTGTIDLRDADLRYVKSLKLPHDKSKITTNKNTRMPISYHWNSMVEGFNAGCDKLKSWIEGTKSKFTNTIKNQGREHEQ